MLLLIALLIFLLWLAGVVTAYTLGGLIHVLLGLAVVLVVLRLIRAGRGV